MPKSVAAQGRSIDAASARLSAHGFAEEFSGCPIGRPFTGHRVDSIGARIEMFDIAAQPYFLDAVGGTKAMPALDEETM
ncbi:hypothetical protein [Nocardia wallacei]|uniref:hypothetical protein n=1 Tax=Nocardia wallacei TaxID=480035 RepID=UPI002455C9B1|nr:hypothetical protein [Nocardia wallacei]